MLPNKMVSEIEALAWRRENSIVTTGDFLRVKIVLRPGRRRLSKKLDSQTKKAVKRLVKAILFGFQAGDKTYGMLKTQLILMYRGLRTGQLKWSFFAKIGV